MKLEHIPLTTELSAEALRSCALLAGLARRLGARITLLHVGQDLRVTPHGAPLARAVSAPDIEQEAGAASDTAQAIVDCAKRKGMHLIALSTHGRTGFRHLELGSVAEAVLRRSPLSVVVFPRTKS